MTEPNAGLMPTERLCTYFLSVPGDDVSVYDPDDVLDRFMSKQGQNR